MGTRLGINSTRRKGAQVTQVTQVRDQVTAGNPKEEEELLLAWVNTARCGSPYRSWFTTEWSDPAVSLHCPARKPARSCFPARNGLTWTCLDHTAVATKW